MLPKDQRNDKKTVEKIFSTGRFVGSAGISAKFFIEGKGSPRISFVVPKTVSKKAAKRNSLRRKGYVAARKLLDRLPEGFVGAFVWKREDADAEKEIETLTDKIHRSV